MKPDWPILLLLGLLVGCGRPSSSGLSTSPLPTFSEIPPVPPAVTATIRRTAQCGALFLVLDPAIATGSSCSSIPQASDPSAPPAEVYPSYSELSLQGYPLSGRHFQPHVDILPVERYQELIPDWIAPERRTLQTLIGGSTPGADELPYLPIIAAQQELYVQYKVIPMQDGSGIRYLTQYSQYADPVNNHELFYTFQGLSNDGQYWIAAVLPVSSPVLPENGNNYSGGETEAQFASGFNGYLSTIAARLNALDATSYTPSLTALDALIASIQTQP
jgi:hypothetical protein